MDQPCESCLGCSWEIKNGQLVCTICGHIEQNFAQYQDDGHQAVGLRVANSVAAPPKELQEREFASGRESVLVYVSAFQNLMRLQAQALIDHLGCPPAIAATVRDLWFRLLVSSKLLTEDELAYVENEVHAAQRMERSTAGMNKMYNSISPATILSNLLHSRLHVSRSLPICLLACWQHRCPVGPMDITRAAILGTLPFFNFGPLSRDIIKGFESLLTLGSFNPYGVIAPVLLANRALGLVKKHDLALPPICPSLWLCRWTLELALPVALRRIAERLHSMYTAGASPEPMLEGRTFSDYVRHPCATLMAALVLACKLAYGLDTGRAPGDQAAWPDALPPCPDWAVWAKSMSERFMGYNPLPNTFAEVNALSEEQQMQYAITASKQHYGYAEVSEDLKPIVDTLYRIAGVDPDQVLAASIVELPSQDVPAAQKKLFDSLWRDGDLGASDEEYFGQMSPAMRVDASAESIGDGQATAPPAGHPSGAKRGREKKGQGIPASSRKEPYAFATAPILWDKDTVELPRDYLLVLTACSMHAWISPLQLHKEVIRLESLVISAELMVNFDDEKDEHDRLDPLVCKTMWAKVVHERVKDELKTPADKATKKRASMQVNKVLWFWEAEQRERDEAAGKNAPAS